MEDFIREQVKEFKERIKVLSEKYNDISETLKKKLESLLHENERYSKIWSEEWNTDDYNSYLTENNGTQYTTLTDEDIFKDIEQKSGINLEEIKDTNLVILKQYHLLQNDMLTEFTFLKGEGGYEKEAEILDLIEKYKWGNHPKEIKKQLSPQYVFTYDPSIINRLGTPPHISVSCELLSLFSNQIAMERFRHLAGRLLRQLEIKTTLKQPKTSITEKATAMPPIKATDYVNSSRLEELRRISNVDFDLAKLICLCEELNDNWQNGNYYSVIALLRTILHHVATAFGQKSFEQVANNYNGGISFKKIANNLLNSSKNIADSHLHGQMQKNESLPNDTQVDFRPDLDFLLSEIVKVLR